MLKIVDKLTKEDTTKLAFMFASQLSLKDIDGVSAVKLLFKLETCGVIDSTQPKTLMELMHVINRKDLAHLVGSAQIPLSIVATLDHSHQMLDLKVSMLARKRCHYSFQRQLITIIAKSDRTTLDEQVVKPCMQKLLVSYEYSAVRHLCMGIQPTEKNCALVKSTLPLVFDFLHSYFSAASLCVSSDAIDMGKLEALNRTCYDCYDKFEDLFQSNQLQWNAALRKDVQKDLTQRRTPSGSAAYAALSCIYDVSNELSGSTSEIEAAMLEADRGLWIIESLFYLYSESVVMTQWLTTVLFLFSEKDTELSMSDLLQATIVPLMAKNLKKTGVIHNELSRILGGVLGEVYANLRNDGVDVIHCDGDTAVTSDHDKYIGYLYASKYAYLMALAQLAYFGSESFSLENFLSKLKAFSLGFMSSDCYALSNLKALKNMMSGYQYQIDKFREEVLRMNALCAAALKEIIPS